MRNDKLGTHFLCRQNSFGRNIEAYCYLFYPVGFVIDEQSDIVKIEGGFGRCPVGEKFKYFLFRCHNHSPSLSFILNKVSVSLAVSGWSPFAFSREESRLSIRTIWRRK